MRCLAVLVGIVLGLAIVASAQPPMKIPNSAYPKVWGALPIMVQGQVARLDFLVAPLDKPFRDREGRWHYTERQEAVSIFVPGGYAKNAIFRAYRDAFMARTDWRLSDLGKSAIAQHPEGWTLTFFAIDFPLGPPVQGWQVAFVNAKVAGMKGTGLWLGLTPPLK